MEIQDITEKTSMCALLGPKSSKVCFGGIFRMVENFHFLIVFRSSHFCSAQFVLRGQIMDELNLGDLTGKAYGSHEHYGVSFHFLIFEVLPGIFHICHIEANGGCNASGDHVNNSFFTQLCAMICCRLLICNYHELGVFSLVSF